MRSETEISAGPICVLGMHRSGTSCLAGSLEQAGVNLGEVVNQSPNNPKGNKESRTLRKINEDLLVFNDGGWDKVPRQLKWTKDLAARRDAHIDAFASTPLWGFKDPRCLITLPFWREVIDDLRFVGTVRHPASVALSLSCRPGLKPRTPPLQLWIDYNQKMLDICQRETVHLVCFDWPEADYLEALENIFVSLGLPDPSGSNPFFETALRDSAPIWPADASELQESAENLYNELLSHISTERVGSN